MRWTLGYSVMMLCLGSLLACLLIYPHELRSPFGEALAFGDDSDSYQEGGTVVYAATRDNSAPSNAPAAAPAGAGDAAAAGATASSAEAQAPAGTTLAQAQPPAPGVAMGMTCDEVMDQFGEPDSISQDGSRWTYGSAVLIFNDSGRLSGGVSYDPVQAALNKYNHAVASVDGTSGKSGKSVGPHLTARSDKILSSNARGYAHSTPVKGFGSSRTQQRSYGAPYGSGGYSNSRNNYYMNDYGPGYRRFYAKPTRPRGMPTSNGSGGRRY